MSSLVVDNPVIEKDSAVLLRAPVTAALVGLLAAALWGILLVMNLSIEASPSSLARWGTLESSGRPMLATLTVLMLLLETFFLPAMASSTIAGERERGTLPLLLVSALSPARIVVGKLGALVLATTVVVVAAVPLFAITIVYGGVEPADALWALVLLAFHGAALACVGVGASAMARRARVAAPLAMVFAVGPSVVLALPGVVAVALLGTGEHGASMAPLLFVGALCDAALAAGALLLARGRLSPRSVPRWPLRRSLVAAVLFVLPPVAVLAQRLSALVESDLDLRRGVGVAMLLQVAALGLGAILLEVIHADAPGGPTHRADAHSPLRQALVCAGLSAAGLVAAWVVSAGGRFAELRDDATSVMPLPIVVVAVVAAAVAFMACFAAAVSRRVKNVVARGVVASGVLGCMLVLPGVVHEVELLLGMPRWMLGFMNPVIVVHELGRGTVSPVASLTFFLVGAVVFGLLAMPKRARTSGLAPG